MEKQPADFFAAGTVYFQHFYPCTVPKNEESVLEKKALLR